MKRLSLICMAALLIMAASCKKEKKNDTGDGIGFRATVENHTDGSKTHLNSDLKVLWNENDAILVKNGKGETGTFKATAYDVEEAEFSDMSGELTQAFLKPDYTAFYPASAVKEDGKIELFGTQDYAENSFASGANPMMAFAESEVLGFKNICGLLKLQLYSETSCTVERIELTSNNNLCGKGTVVWNNGEPKFDGELTEGGKTITLNCLDKESKGVTLSNDDTKPTAFYFVLPTGALASGFSVKVVEKETGEVWSKETEKDNHIERSKITVMDAQKVTPHTPLLPSSVTVSSACVNCLDNLKGTVTVPETMACELGFVYSTSDAKPTIEGGGSTHIVHELTDDAIPAGTKDFMGDLSTLVVNKLLYLRAYARTADGVVYSSEEDVKTLTVPQPLPETWNSGHSPKLFTVGTTAKGTPKKVYFSPGNLQYVKSTTKWQFASHQFDIAERANQNVGNKYAAQDVQSLFGWGDVAPLNTSTTDSDYSFTTDWGTKIDGNWRTLTFNEWGTLLKNRDNASDLWAYATVGCMPGMIFLPDEWEELEGVAFTAGCGNGFNTNAYNYLDWSKMEEAGAIFLPAAGYRDGAVVNELGNHGRYWSSTNSTLGNAQDLIFVYDKAAYFVSSNCHYGFTVRLVTDETE